MAPVSTAWKRLSLIDYCRDTNEKPETNGVASSAMWPASTMPPDSGGAEGP